LLVLEIGIGIDMLCFSCLLAQYESNCGPNILQKRKRAARSLSFDPIRRPPRDRSRFRRRRSSGTTRVATSALSSSELRWALGPQFIVSHRASEIDGWCRRVVSLSFMQGGRLCVHSWENKGMYVASFALANGRS